MSNRVYVDEEGGKVRVYDNDAEIELVEFTEGDQDQRRDDGERYAIEQAQRLGCGYCVSWPPRRWG